MLSTASTPNMKLGTERSVSSCLESCAQNHFNYLPVILVAHLVLPRPEASARQNVLALEVGQDLVQRVVALDAWRRVAVVEAADVRADDLVVGPEQLRVDEALDAVLEQGGVVHGLVRGLGHLEHDGPVRAGLRLG